MIFSDPTIRRVHFIGIKGVAMTGLAVIAKLRGKLVAGSDVPEKFITDKILAENKIEVFEGFAAENLDWKPDVVVVGTSWGPDNVEVEAAGQRGIPMVSDSEVRGQLSREKRTIAITGVHGKTTTTAMLAHVLRQAGQNPSYLIGTGAVRDLGGNANWSDGPHFVVEGDEYIRSQQDRVAKFLDLSPAISIITSIEWEHVDVYPDVASLEQSFRTLANQTTGVVIGCGDWPSVQVALTGVKTAVERYGLDEANDWVATDIRNDFDGMEFGVIRRGEVIGNFKIQLHGKHNVVNALAVLIAASIEGVPIGQIQRGLASFTGTERRFDVSERGGITFVDDYGHHPSEVKATLEAIRHRYPDKKIWCVFQPHMASRTKALLSSFATAFSNADRVFIADIFASAREPIADITSQELAAAVAAHHKAVQYTGDLNETLQAVAEGMPSGTVLVTMGAGDVYRVRDKFVERFEGKKKPAA